MINYRQIKSNDTGVVEYFGGKNETSFEKKKGSMKAAEKLMNQPVCY